MTKIVATRQAHGSQSRSAAILPTFAFAMDVEVFKEQKLIIGVRIRRMNGRTYIGLGMGL